MHSTSGIARPQQLETCRFGLFKYGKKNYWVQLICSIVKLVLLACLLVLIMHAVMIVHQIADSNTCTFLLLVICLDDL